MSKKAVKIVISGPVGAGKTTLIRTLSQTPVVNTDELSTEVIGKTHTTVALDFGQIDLCYYMVHNFCTPGQERFDFMWDELSRGALCLLLLVPCDRPEDFPHARKILEFVTSRHPVPFVIASTRHDIAPNGWQAKDIASYFNLPENQVIPINAENRESVRSAVVCLMQQVESAMSAA